MKTGHTVHQGEQPTMDIIIYAIVIVVTLAVMAQGRGPWDGQ